MEEDGAVLEVGFAIDFRDSFGQLRSLDDIVGDVAANTLSPMPIASLAPLPSSRRHRSRPRLRRSKPVVTSRWPCRAKSGSSLPNAPATRRRPPRQFVSRPKPSAV